MRKQNTLPKLRGIGSRTEVAERRHAQHLPHRSKDCFECTQQAMRQRRKDIVFEQYEEIRAEGRVNMMDRLGVKGLAILAGHRELADQCESSTMYAAVFVGYGEWKERTGQ